MPGAFPPSRWEGIKLSPALAGSSHAHTTAPAAAAAASAPGAAGCSVPAAPTARSHGTPTLLPGHRAVPDPLVPCTDSHGHCAEPHEGGGTCSPTACPGHAPAVTMGLSPGTPGALVCRTMVL